MSMSLAEAQRKAWKQDSLQTEDPGLLSRFHFLLSVNISKLLPCVLYPFKN